MSVAEAMLGGCIPVTTEAGALPEVTGECGVRIRSRDAGDIAEAIQTALNCSDMTRASIRNRILEQFPMENRRRQLEEVILPLVNGQRPR